ncbi:glycosyltransferase [Candidatus Saccharibacteria bacterium]|nr:glycosyltransferase [Candidatus Saccharibacteria bacterium]
MKSTTPPDLSNLKIALVCDWLTEVGGAEKVLLAVHEMFPAAPIYTSQFRAKSTFGEFRDVDIRTGWLNIFPRALRKFISPLRYFYFSHLDLSDYDLVISICNAEAKNIKTSTATHISYLQGPPPQYYWGQYDEYIKNPGVGKLNFLARFGLKILIKLMRKTDFKTAQKPNYLLANSTYAAEEIKKYYNRETEILWPLVDVKNLQKLTKKIPNNQREGFIIAGRQASWKRTDLAVAACIKLNEKLLVIGDGPEHKNLIETARGHNNIKFLPRYDGASEIVKYLKSSRGFIFPSLEPFGITPIEALVAGTPVIALRAGGALDFIKDGQNGIFFNEQTTESLIDAMKKFEKTKFDRGVVSRSAELFSEAQFKQSLQKFIIKCLKESIHE